MFPGYDTRLTQGGDEWDLLRRLRARGRVVFNPRNRTLTFSRRLQRGLVYNIVVTCLYYYVLGYVLNRVTGRTVMGMAPAIRNRPRRAGESVDRRGRYPLVEMLAAVAIVAVLGAFAVEWVELA